MKLLIFDSSSLISLTMSGIEEILEELKKTFPGKFIITNQVKYETSDIPINIKRFELGALKISQMLKENILEMPSGLKIGEEEIKAKTREILNAVNNLYYARGRFMHIIDNGEASCLALSLIASERKIENAIIVDERTTRMLGEAPENLKKLFESKLHVKVELKNDFSLFKGIKFLRSSELVYLAYKKGLIKIKDSKLLDALLYSVKYKGCSISQQEIEEIKRLS